MTKQLDTTTRYQDEATIRRAIMAQQQDGTRCPTCGRAFDCACPRWYKLVREQTRRSRA